MRDAQTISRPIPVALTALVAFFSALAALAVSNGMDMAQAHGNAPHSARAPMTMTVSPSVALSPKSVALHRDLRNAAGNELTRQLRTHILIAADLIAAAKAGDKAKLADAQARWAANADQIATVLHSVNPRFWPLGTLKAEMQMHLRLTVAEAVARLQRHWAADVVDYDKVHRHILRMSDLLADGDRRAVPCPLPLSA